VEARVDVKGKSGVERAVSAESLGAKRWARMKENIARPRCILVGVQLNN